MKKKNPLTKKKSSPLLLYLAFFPFGLFIGAASLIVNQQFPVQLYVASVFSPTGAQVTIAGLRIKHWLVGFTVGLIGIGAVLKDSKIQLFKFAGITLTGIGVFLMADEYMDIYRFITEGEYP